MIIILFFRIANNLNPVGDFVLATYTLVKRSSSLGKSGDLYAD